MDASRRALVEDTEPKACQVVPSVEYCQVPLPVVAVMARALRALVSTSTQLAAVKSVDAAIAGEVVSSLVVVKL